MFDIGWTELLLIGTVALIVVGPKDLPGMFRTLGRVTARMRSMAREFQRAMDQAADESGVKDVAADLRTATSARRLGLDTLQDTARRFQSGNKEDTVASASSKASEKPAETKSDGSGKSGDAKSSAPLQSGLTETAAAPKDTGTAQPGSETADRSAVAAETVRQPETAPRAEESVEISKDTRQ